MCTHSRRVSATVWLTVLGCPRFQVLVHGDSHEMMRLKTGLVREYEEVDKTIDVRTPKNCEDVELHFRGERMAKVRG